MMRSFKCIIIILLTLVFAGCSANGFLATDKAVSGSASGRGVIPLVPVLSGVLGPGAEYEIYVPQNWTPENDLILFVHGFEFPQEQFIGGLPEEFAFLAPAPIPSEMFLPFLEMGDAVAYSKFSEQGYALKDGANRTKQLRSFFCDRIGTPRDTYLVGYSLGGAISIMLAEKNPDLFSGALTVSGMIGGGAANVSYIMDSYLVFKYFFGSVLISPSGQHLLPEIGEWPDSYTQQDLENLYTGIVSVLVADIELNSGLKLKAMLSATSNGSPIFQVPPDETDTNTILSAVLSPLCFALFGGNDLYERIHMHNYYNNQNTVYSYFDGFGMSELNLPIYVSRSDADAYLRRWYEPRGNLRIPVINIHNPFDPVVPYSHSIKYGVLASASGFFQEIVSSNEVGHTNITFEELFNGYLSLKWMVFGQ